MTPAEWKRVENALAEHGWATLRVDGYLLSLHVHRIKALSYAIWIYVDGAFKGRWILEDCEERRRFMQCKVHRLRTGTLQQYVKLFGKREGRAQFAAAAWTSFHPYWTNFGALRRHLVNNNTSIELVEAS